MFHIKERESFYQLLKRLPFKISITLLVFLKKKEKRKRGGNTYEKQIGKSNERTYVIYSCIQWM